jgi:hypothetical protein
MKSLISDHQRYALAALDQARIEEQQPAYTSTLAPEKVDIQSRK